MRLLSLFALALAGLANASDEAMLRRLMVDARFISIISPCKTGGTNRNNAAEWLRTAFHDATSHNAAAGTGGVDASIQYETGYSENGGVAFSSVITQYKFYRQQSVSLADIVALGAIVAVGSCGGPMIPFYHGRIDAAGEAGEGFVPKPEETTETHIERFARMGFSQTEMISLIACGHTLGGVHASVNPTITTEAYQSFDDSLSAFDNNIAVQHINDTRTGPLGQAYDPEYPQRSSDTRIFSSDGNVTIRAHAADNNQFINACDAVLGKLFNSVPSAASLQGPIVPFPVSGTLRMALRNGAYSVSIASARVYDMVGQWSSYDIVMLNRDGSEAAPITVKTLRTQSIGKTIEIKDFSTPSGIAPATGLSGFLIKLTLNDGSVYSSAEKEELIKVDDTIILDYGNQNTCTYAGDTNGLNVTAAVLGPFNAGDRVDVLLRTYAGETTVVRASFRAARDAYYNSYGAFIADIDSLNTYAIGVRLTRADGSVHVDTRDDVYWTLNTFSKCVAGAEVPAPAPIPSSSVEQQRRRRRADRLEAAPACASGFTACGNRCVNTAKDIEHCGGCAGFGGVDCTTLTDGGVSCIAGKCVKAEEFW